MTGTLEVICGPMFSGKSEELIRKIKRILIAKKEAVVFKHALDSGRYDISKVVSHSGASLEALPVENAAMMLEKLNEIEKRKNIDVIGIDEGNFFDDDIIDVLDGLVKKGKHVVVAGLDKDFRGETFGPMGELLAKADYVTKLDAICMKCGSLATMTQRILNGKVPHYNDPVKIVGASDKYEARCRRCHEVRRE